VRAIYVRLGARRLEWAKAEELATLLGAMKAKTPVYCHAHSLSNASLMFTLKGCTKTWLSPAGDVDAIGISTQNVYFKSLLDKLGVKADFLAIGKYKSAAESFLRDGPSDAARAEWLETLGSIRDRWLETVRAVRPEVVESLETGPFGARAALERKLVDALGDEHEARADVLTRFATEDTKIAFGPDKDTKAGDTFADILAMLAGAEEGASHRPHIAVVPLSGAITMAADGLFESEGITERGLARTVERLIDDDLVRAVVLRIDSPGGSALASDLMWSRLRELGRRKPIVTSVGSMAASGGYYLACAAQHIVAEPTSIVGSIGVVGGKIVIGPALEPYGVYTVTLTTGTDANRAAYESPLLPWDEGTRARVYDQMLGVYDLFVDRVAEGRKRPREQVLAVAEGRIFSGRQGLDNGLVDQLGGLAEALKWARERSGLGQSAPVTVEGAGDGLLSALGLDADASMEQFSSALENHRRRLFRPLAMTPLAYRPWVSAVVPLLGHERVLALSTFATLEP
jgi:protease-4